MVVLNDLPPPTEGIRFTQPQIKAVLENHTFGIGTLYITESCVSWVGPDNRGFSLQYPSISLHAVSRDLSNYPEACLYLMIDAAASDGRPKTRRHLPPVYYEDTLSENLAHWNIQSPSTQGSDILPAGASGSAENGDAENEEDEQDCGQDQLPPIAEMRFIPADRTALDMMFDALADCQALHPDEEDIDEDGEGEMMGDLAEDEDGWYTGADGEEPPAMSEEGQATLDRLMAASGDTAHSNGDTNGNDDTMEEDG